MKNIKIIIPYLQSAFLFIAILALTACINTNQESPTKSTSVIKSQNDQREYDVVVLPNQIEILLISDPSTERSAVALAVKAGSYDEKDGFWGLAHFLEHMLFLGTKKYPEEGSFNTFIAKNGGVNNAYTYMDHTNYMASIRNSAYDELLDRFSDYFKAPLLSTKYIDKERNAVHSEWSMKGVYDGVILGHLNGLTLNPEHPVANFTWGNLDTLKDQNNQTLKQATDNFFKEHYHASRMKVVLLSNLSITELKSKASRHFSAIPNNISTKEEIDIPVITQAQNQKLIQYKPKKDIKKIQLKFIIENNASEFKFKPNYYLSYLINSEMPGALVDTLKAKKLIESLYSWADPTAFGNAGEFVIDISLTDQGLRQRDLIISQVFNYLTLIRSEGISKKYFLEIKQSLKNSFDYQDKYSEYNYAAKLAADMHLLPIHNILNGEFEYTAFKAQPIKQLLAQLTTDNIRVFYIDSEQAPQKHMNYFDAAYQIKDISAQQLRAWQHGHTNNEATLPKLNHLMPSDFTLVAQQYTHQPKLFTSQHGSELVLKHSQNFSTPKGGIKLNLNSNLGTRTAKEQALLLLLVDSINKEVRQLSSQAYNAGVSLNIIKEQGLMISTSGFSQHQLALLNQVLNITTSLDLTQDEFKQAKQLLTENLLNQSKNALYSQAFNHYNSFIALEEFPTKELLAELEDISQNDLRFFSSQFFNQAKLKLLAYGNFEENSVIDQIKTMESQLNKVQKEHITPNYVTQYNQLSEKEFVNLRINAQQKDVAIIDAKWQKSSIEKEAAGIILAKIISPELFRQIRTEEQLGYSVGFYSTVKGNQISYVWYIQTPVKSPREIMARIEHFKINFKETINTLTPSQLEQFRQAVLTVYNAKAKNIYQEQSYTIKDWQNDNLSFNSKARLIDAIKSVSVSDIQQLYLQLLDPQQMARILVQVKGSNYKKDEFIQ